MARQALTRGAQGKVVDSEDIVPDRLYYVMKYDMYFVTPDGIGGYWYEDEDEVIEQYGEVGTVHTVDEITD